jgi:hypothetical protein
VYHSCVIYKHRQKKAEFSPEQQTRDERTTLGANKRRANK